MSVLGLAAASLPGYSLKLSTSQFVSIKVVVLVLSQGIDTSGGTTWGNSNNTSNADKYMEQCY